MVSHCYLFCFFPASNEGLESGTGFIEGHLIPYCIPLIDCLRLPNPRITSIQTDVTHQFRLRRVRRNLLAVPQWKSEECPNITWPDAERDSVIIKGFDAGFLSCTPDFSHSPRPMASMERKRRVCLLDERVDDEASSVRLI